MDTPLQITFHQVDNSKTAEEKIRSKAEKLEKYCDKIVSCKVVIEQTQKSKQQGKQFDVKINLAVPGKELIVRGHDNESLDISIRDSFLAMQRQLEEYNQKKHGEVKTHAELLHGVIDRMFEDKEFGFITGTDDTEYYFHANNVVHPSFKKLQIGDKVHFIEFMGDEGPQAHRVSAHKD